MLLTAAGRTKLTEHFRTEFGKDTTSAVITGLDTSFTHLDSVEFFSDYSRDNDLSYYVIGKGNGEGKFELQGKGKTFLVPRGAGVSVGERRDFAGLLAHLASLTASNARKQALDAAPERGGSSPLLGVQIQFSAQEDGTHLADGSLHLGNRMDFQMLSAATAKPDFFAVSGCASGADVELVARILSKRMLRHERRELVDWKGNEYLEDETSAIGFDIPALLLVESAGAAALAEIAKAAAASDRIAGIALDAPLDDAALDSLHSQLGGGAVVVGPSPELPDGEMKVLRSA